MVEGLQSALYGKVDRPVSQGSYFAQIDNNGSYIWRNIIPAVNYLMFWNGYNFESSNLYRNPINGRIGVGTTDPQEQLHLMGRGRMSGLVLDENTESLPGQITRSGNRFSGTNSSGVKRPLMYADYDDTLALYSNFSTAQALSLAQVLNGGLGSGGNMSVNLISPPIIQNQYDAVEYVLLRGANLNLNALSMGVQILASDKTTVVATIPNNQIQLNSNGLELIFYYNFYNFTEGQYFIKLISGAKIYITSLDIKIVPSVIPLDLTTIQWGFIYDSGTTPNPNDNATNGNFTIVTPVGNTATPKVSLKSSELFAQGDDFYIELNITIGQKNWTNQSNHNEKSYIGLGYSSTNNSLNVAAQIYMAYSSAYDNRYVDLFNNQVGTQFLFSPFTIPITIIKTGNLFRTIFNNYQDTKTLSNNEGYSIFAQILGRDTAGQTITAQIVKAFKLN